MKTKTKTASIDLLKTIRERIFLLIQKDRIIDDANWLEYQHKKIIDSGYKEWKVAQNM